MSSQDLIAEMRDEYIERARAQAEHEFDKCISNMESPIEKLFVGAMICGEWRLATQNEEAFTKPMQASMALKSRFWPLANYSCVYICFEQPTIELGPGRLIRPDLVFITNNSGRMHAPPVFVELDGHDFHERTKEQARRDKSRDRELAIRGWIHMRFTGSEVYKDPDGCVLELEKVLGRPLAL